MHTLDAYWYTFCDAVAAKDLVLAAELLRQYPVLLASCNGLGETVLHFLAVENDAEGVAWLHARGANIDTKNNFGTPVLFEVASLGYKELFLWLVERGVDVRAIDAEGQDIVAHLLEYNRTEMAAWVQSNGA